LQLPRALMNIMIILLSVLTFAFIIADPYREEASAKSQHTVLNTPTAVVHTPPSTDETV